MMGAHHAITGAAVWLGATQTIDQFPALGLIHLSPQDAVFGAVIAAGAALLPDADHPQATIAHSLGGISKAATTAVGSASGGHRHGTHAPLVALLVLILMWWVSVAHLLTGPWMLTHEWVLAIPSTMLLCWAVKTLKVVRSWPPAWLTGLAVSALITWAAPTVFLMLPLAIGIGWVTHLAGDLLTVGGLPWSWPLGLKPRTDHAPFLSKGGYFALPVLGTAGSWREWLMCVPVTAYVLWGVAVNGYVFVSAL